MAASQWAELVLSWLQDAGYILVRNVLGKVKGEEYFVDGWDRPGLTLEAVEMLFDRIYLNGGAEAFMGRKLRELEFDGEFGRFLSPVHEYLPQESKYAFFRVFHPGPKRKTKGVVILTPYLGEMVLDWRKARAKELNRKGYIVVLPEIALVMSRKPANQIKGFFRTVADTVLHAIASIAEVTLLLYHINEEVFPDLPVQVAGFSMGASIALCVGASARSGKRFAVSAFAPIHGLSTLVTGIVGYNLIGCKKDWIETEWTIFANFFVFDFHRRLFHRSGTEERSARLQKC